MVLAIISDADLPASIISAVLIMRSYSGWFSEGSIFYYRILTIPINIRTLGLLIFVINAFLLMMTSDVIGGLFMHRFGSAMPGSLIDRVMSWQRSSFVHDYGRIESTHIELFQLKEECWQQSVFENLYY